MPTAGGSLPLFIFVRVLQIPLIIVPMVNHDNNQHAENKSLRMQNLWDGYRNVCGDSGAFGTGLGINFKSQNNWSAKIIRSLSSMMEAILL